MSHTETKSSVESIKLNQDLLTSGYIRENASCDVFPPSLIPIIISFINCILDLIYDKTINGGKYTWYSDKKIELEHFDWEEGEGGVALIDQIFNKEICRNFRIDFRITWGDEKKPILNENKSDKIPDDPDITPPPAADKEINLSDIDDGIDISLSGLSDQVAIPAFNVGYLTNLDEEMRNNLKGKVCYEQLGHRGAINTYGIGISRSGIAMYQDAKYNRNDKDFKFDKELEQGDIISLFFSFESYKSAIYHNYKKVGDCFKHQSDEIANIYPAISMWSWEEDAEVARVEILIAILNVEE